MEDERISGLMMLLLAAAIFLASAHNLIPPASFFAGIPLGIWAAVRIMRGSRTADAVLERRVLRNTNPLLKNTQAMKTAEIQSRHAIEMDDGNRHVAQSIAVTNEMVGDELVLYELDDENDDKDLEITTDVSFPLEMQERGSIADQIEKLRRLAADGVLSQEEFEAAKARVLS